MDRMCQKNGPLRVEVPKGENRQVSAYVYLNKREFPLILAIWVGFEVVTRWHCTVRSQVIDYEKPWVGQGKMGDSKVKESKISVAAHCLGVDVPDSPFLNEQRINRINRAKYEGQEIAGGIHLVKKGDNVLELGAGIGLVGAVVSKNCMPAKVLSFEANPSLISHIRNLYKVNKLGKRNFVRNEVLVAGPDRPETLPFHIHNSFLGSSLNGDPDRAKETVDVPTVDFETIRQELKPDILLIDIEGGEQAILEHANLDGIRGIVIEFHPKAYGVEGMRACKHILRTGGFEPLKDFSTRMVWVAERSV